MDEGIRLLVGQVVEGIAEGFDPLAFEQVVHLRVIQVFDGFFGLEVEGIGFLFQLDLEGFFFGEPFRQLNDLRLVSFWGVGGWFSRLEPFGFLGDGGRDELVALFGQEFAGGGGFFVLLAEVFQSFFKGCGDFAQAGFLFAQSV